MTVDVQESNALTDGQGLSRRGMTGLLMSLAGVLACPTLAPAAGKPVAGKQPGPIRLGPARAFSRERLVAMAQAAARRPFAPRVATNPVPDFDSHVRLSYGKAEMIAGNIRLFPAARDTAPNTVTIHIVEHGQARTVIDTHGLFGDNQAADPAGFRVLNPDGNSDWLAFLGASYFRASGPQGQFGLSARAIAVDTALPGPEEFPAFTDFWVEGLGPDRLVISALVEGPSLSGAFVIETSRTKTAMIQDVTATLFMRQDVRRLGLAPITTMFDFDEGSAPGNRGDWRHEVHDSDGLAIRGANGERIWRPLDNPPDGPRVHMFRADHLKGFGMIQRDQDFGHYQDANSFYDKRPSLWVEPKGDWGPGAVMLYEMAAISETVDNMAAMWVADSNARCVNVFVGPGGVPGHAAIAGVTRYVFDFAGPVLHGLDRGSVQAITDLPAKAVLLNNGGPVNGVWRVTMDVRTQGLAQSEFRLFLKQGDSAISETVIKTVRP